VDVNKNNFFRDVSKLTEICVAIEKWSQRSCRPKSTEIYSAEILLFCMLASER